MNLYACYRTGAVFARVLPRPFTYWIGLRLADVHYRRKGEDRRAVISNLRQIYQARGIVPSEDVLEGVARKTFQYFGKYLIDFFRFTQISFREYERLFSVEHVDYLEQTRSAGRGVILLTAHFGNWELGGALMTYLGYPVYTVYLPEHLEKVNQYFYKTRSKRGFQLVPYGQAARSLFRLLKQGEMVTLLGDRDFSERDDRIPFFGKPARIPRGAAVLSRRTGAPIVPGFLLRQVDDTFLMRFHPPLYPELFGDDGALHRKIGSVLEKELGENPHQWYIFEDFWA